jgi:hypothetical protein
MEKSEAPIEFFLGFDVTIWTGIGIFIFGTGIGALVTRIAISSQIRRLKDEMACSLSLQKESSTP